VPYKDPEKAKERLRRYRAAHPEKIRAIARKAGRKYRAANPEKVREANRKYAATHPERVRKKYADWLSANPDYHREWSATNRDKECASSNRRRSLKAGDGGSYTAEEWLALCAQYDNQCIGPGPHGGKLTVDHVIPVGQPGSTSNIDNLQPLCKSCNVRKGTKTIDYRSV